MSRHLRTLAARCGASSLVLAAALAGPVLPAAAAAPALVTSVAPAGDSGHMNGGYPVHAGSLQALGRDHDLCPGKPLELSGSGFTPGANVELGVRSKEIPLGSVKADATGAFTHTVTLPGAGEHTLAAIGPHAQGGTLMLTIEISVGDRCGKELAHTGGNAVGAAGASAADGAGGLGLGALSAAGLGVAGLVGGGAFVVVRRRTRC